MGIRSVRRGIQKCRAKAPRGREKGPKNKKFIFENFKRKRYLPSIMDFVSKANIG